MRALGSGNGNFKRCAKTESATPRSGDVLGVAKAAFGVATGVAVATGHSESEVSEVVFIAVDAATDAEWSMSRGFWAMLIAGASALDETTLLREVCVWAKTVPDCAVSKAQHNAEMETMQSRGKNRVLIVGKARKDSKPLP